MPRDRSPNRDKAYELYKERGGEITNREIAGILGEDEKKVAVWKQRDKWNVVQQSKERCTTKPRVNKKAKNHKAIDKAVEQIMDNEDLNEKQKLFCIYYAKYFNATKAAIKAGYSQSTAQEQGSRLLSKAIIQDEIRVLKQDKLKGAMLEPGDLLQKYIDIAFADINDYVEFGREEIQVIGAFGPIMVEDEDGEKSPLMKEINIVKLRNSSELDGTIISEVKQGKDGASIKLQDKMKALDFLSRNIGLLDIETKAKLENMKEKLELERLRNKDYGITDDEERTGVVLLPVIDESLLGEDNE